MSQVLEYLQQFNRKERFHLIGLALDNPSFSLGPMFRGRLRSALGFTVPDDAFCAMDYHLDWLYASLYLSQGGRAGHVFERDPLKIAGTQEDADLLIAFDDGPIIRIIILEAKGVGGWNNDQMKSKAKRLGAIFGESGDEFPFVHPYFVIASPRRPIGLKTIHWPEWMIEDGRLRWIEMPISVRQQPTRCTAEGQPLHLGAFWTVVDKRPTSKHNRRRIGP